MRTIVTILLIFFGVSVFGQFNEKPVLDNIELVGASASIDKVGNLFIVSIDDVMYKASGLEQALNMVYQTKIRSHDDYSFADQKWGLLMRVTVDDGGWTVDMGGDERYHADSFLKSKEIVFDLFYDMLKGRLIFNYHNLKYGDILK